MHVHLLDITRRPGRVVYSQLRTLTRDAAALAKAGAPVFTHQSVSDTAGVEQAAASSNADVFALVCGPFDPVSDVIEQLRAIRRVRPAARVVLLDTFDPCNTPHLSALPEVDRYLKNAVFADPTQYTRPLHGGSLITDYLCGKLGYHLDSYDFGSLAATDQLHKIVLSWNMGVDSFFRKLVKLAGLITPAWTNRPVDVSVRLGVESGTDTLAPGAIQGLDWYKRHRYEALRAALQLRGRFVLGGVERVSRRTYYLEMMRSKIIISPFGYGEICFRDFEAACCGCLLVKPRMDHVRTTPDIFVPEETYVPVAWDFSDLAEKTAWYLTHPANAQRIAATARERLVEYYRTAGYAQDIAAAFEGL